mmetsp:Transcript_14386/g.24068  ORF Transcript_14386/g.24068 Transcript_14386/m.24068 type:complete len:370 (+) Transcript_14386:247-1356(+)
MGIAHSFPPIVKENKERANSDTTSEQSGKSNDLPQDQLNISRRLQTEMALWGAKNFFEAELLRALNLTKVSAPLFVRGGTGLSDCSVLKPNVVSFEMADGSFAEIPRALSRWKRVALNSYGITPGNGGICIYMNGIRPTAGNMDDTHSHFVDQWDWEVPLLPEERTLETLKTAVRRIYRTLTKTAKFIQKQYGIFTPMPSQITFIHSSQLQQEYPDLTPEERETQACLKYGAVFVIGIGATLADGLPHGARNADLDDWSTQTELGPGLNGDILVLWRGQALELSSMSIRVDAKAMAHQLKERNLEKERMALPFTMQVLRNEVPLTIGGGIGISRVAMFLLQKRHIAEVQSSVWPPEMVAKMEAEGIEYL